VVIITSTQEQSQVHLFPIEVKHAKLQAKNQPIAQAKAMAQGKKEAAEAMDGSTV